MKLVLDILGGFALGIAVIAVLDLICHVELEEMD